LTPIRSERLDELKTLQQYDGTEVGVANQLIEMGVPKQDIVLAFHEPEVRQFTDFAVG
jgi:hypothetical protein